MKMKKINVHNFVRSLSQAVFHNGNDYTTFIRNCLRNLTADHQFKLSEITGESAFSVSAQGKFDVHQSLRTSHVNCG